MSLSATFLHGYPQTQIASIIRDRLARCSKAQIVSGFATPDGIAALRAAPLARKIDRVVLGAGTFKAFDALDGLIAGGLPVTAARVHLGHTRRTGGKKHPFERLRPMLHSKIYLFEMPDGSTSAFVGSHNLTGFALRGTNGEAGVLFEGPSSDPTFDQIRAHVDESYQQAVPYDATLKEAYARWYADYFERLRIETGDMPQDTESRRTIVLFAEASPGASPTAGQRVYFEIDKRIDEIKALETEVHLRLFLGLPPSPRAALATAPAESRALLASVEAIDSGAGSAEIEADWFVEDRKRPILKPTVRPFRPHLRSGYQQVRALIRSTLDHSYDYLFDEGSSSWTPTLDDNPLTDEETGIRWNRVTGFQRSQELITHQLAQRNFLPELSPDSGSFILFSRKRRMLR